MTDALDRPRPARTRPAGPDRRSDIALVPLRAFLGITYAFAGLQKLASTSYLSPTATAGVAAQMRAAAHTSPIAGVLGTVQQHATVFGLLIAFGELAVGIGMILGLWTRAAAVGGMALALSFLLAVSWHSNPYYLGPDIVFLAAFTPFAIAPPSRWSVDGAVARRLRLERPNPSAPAPDEARRRFLETLTIAGWAGAVGLLGGGAVAAMGRLVGSTGGQAAGGAIRLHPPVAAVPNGSTTTAATTTGATTTGGTETPSTTPPATTIPGTAVGRASDVPVGGGAQFADPATGATAIVVQPTAGSFEACSAICTHEGCTLGYNGAVLQCPCHGAEFDPATGAVLQGPAEQPLATLKIRSAADGNLYVEA
ncbi:Rieske 2Fe-2S domain-containing protein [Aquihabitans sp. McL0605]|uniref:Rieske 2Fe-2S domain-containing protein n=1 Tax=Aquihabitans sp. McL0605 TaxID=3415671 RepID=UPI003CE8346F